MPDAVAALERQSGARWDLGWDPTTGTARWGRAGASQGRGGSSPQAQARAFLDRHAPLLGAQDTELRAVRARAGPGAWHATWQQTLHGEIVVGAFVDLTCAENAGVVAFRSTLLPGLRATARGAVKADGARDAVATYRGAPLEIESAARVWVPRVGRDHVDVRAAWQLELRGVHGARWWALVDALDARVLAFESLLRTEVLDGTTTGDVKPRYAHEPNESAAFAWLNVHLQADGSNNTNTTSSSAAGAYRFSIAPGNYDLAAGLDGLYVTVSNHGLSGPSPGFRTAVAVPGREDVRLDVTNSRDDERTIYFHTNVIHDYVRERFGFTLLDFPVPAVAAVRNPTNGSTEYANAFWDGTRMAYGNGAGRFLNFGLFADVIYHEYTHAITDHAYRPVGGLRGQIGGAIHEGLSDYFACTLTDEPQIGEFLSGGPDALRDLDHDLLWPEDRHPNNEVHANGLIFAGALWHVRELVGADVADPVVHFAREFFPQDFEEYLDAMLLQDDLLFGDGVPGNGSPHRDAILAAFARHGMGPLGSREVRIQHQALRDTEDEGRSREVLVHIGSLFPNAVDGVELQWRVDGGPFTAVDMQANGRGGYVAAIPGQPAGAHVEYWLRSFKLRPFEEQRLPEGAPDALLGYRVGPDLTPPRITHGARAEVPAFAWPADLHVRIEDNLGLAYAYLQYTLNGVPGSTVGLVPTGEDPSSFTTRFPNVGGRVGDVVEYWITAVDASRAAHRTRFPAEGTVRVQLVRELEEGFEQGASAWVHAPAVAGQPDPWHVSEDVNHTPGGRRAWWCGSNMDEYPVRTAAELRTDWYRIDPGARATVWSWMDAEENGPLFAFDGGIVQVQVEGNLGWDDLEPAGGYSHRMSDTSGSNMLLPGTPCLSGRDGDWQLLEFDLDPWTGQRVRLRFVFASDHQESFQALRGWLLDDFTLTPGERAPTDAAARPGSRPERLLASSPGPNPFNPNVRFDLDIPSGAGHVRLEIHDVRGRLVARLLDAALPPGAYRLVWNGRDVSGRESASGAYYFTLASGLGEEKGRLVLLR